MKKNQAFTFLAVCAIALAFAGCSTVTSQPKVHVISTHLTNAITGQVTSAILQSQVMRFADTYVAMVSQGCDDATDASTNTDVRLAALRWKLQQATAAYNDATGENPPVNALDLLVLTTLARDVVQDIGASTFGTNVVQPLLDAQIAMESNAWDMASSILTPAQQAELRAMIRQWHQKYPHQHNIGAIRFREFAAALGQAPQPSQIKATSVFSLLYLNPLSGLDPTTAAIEGIRQLGERTVYYTQRMPTLLNWQAQLLAYQLESQPESQQIQADFNRISLSTATFAQTAQQLPQLINDQRQAAIQQILDGLIAQQEKAGQLMTNTRLTLDSAATAASNINSALQSLTAFVEYVSPTNSSQASASTNNSSPFNVLDYGTAAAQIGAMATNVNNLLTTANQSLPQIEKINAQVADHADAVVHHAFFLGLILVLILLAGAVVAGLTYRVLVHKLCWGSVRPPEPKPQ
jgi:hypothetical protein